MFNNNVLVVDDEEFIIRLYSDLLTGSSATPTLHSDSMDTYALHLAEKGFKLHSATSGAKAVELVAALADQNEHIAFGFFDMRMPGGMDGLETIRQIRQIDPQVLCTFVSGYTSWNLEEINLVFGPDHFDDWDFMGKPFSPEEVIQKARNWVSAWNRRRREQQQAFKLHELLQQIERMNQDLECRVDERTIALAETNWELALKNQELENVLTELKVTQSQLLQNEKLASLGQLAAGMAHEINNPIGFVHSNLNTLATYADRLSQHLEVVRNATSRLVDNSILQDVLESQRKLKIEYVTKDLKNIVAQSIDGTNRVQQIVRDLKTFSRVDEAELQLADINAGIRSTLNIVNNELKYKAKITTELGELPEILCYPMQLNQVFLNLLVNAGQAIPETGEIGVRTWVENDAIRVSVSDSGCGIPEENMKRIFEPFFTTKPVGTGTGLGLSMSYSIVKKHKGELEVHSRKDEGTTFTVILPLNAFGEECAEESGSLAQVVS